MWIDVDRFFERHVIDEDDALKAAMAASEAAALPPISVTPAQGRLLQVLARTVNARRILEIGTLGGYSTIWLARALAPGGRLITLEYERKHADVARANIARAGLTGAVEIRVGRAQDLLPDIHRAGGDPFDFIFIDADKPSTTAYFEWSLKLSRPGSLIFVDNVVREGGIADASSVDEDVKGMRRFTEWLATERRVLATAIQTVGSKSYDGFALALVR